jgi:hypothetical protein
VSSPCIAPYPRVVGFTLRRRPLGPSLEHPKLVGPKFADEAKERHRLPDRIPG